RDPYDLASALLLSPERVAAVTSRVEPHVDDIPAVEYESGRILTRAGSWLQNFEMLGKAMSPLQGAFTDVGDPGRLTRTDAERRQRYAAHLEVVRREAQREAGRAR